MKSRVNEPRKQMLKKEWGGTILGLIIGLAIGLGVAVVVAVMITKTSSPFTNRLGMTKPSDMSPIQLTDPNKPLYGNAYKDAPEHKPVAEKSFANSSANVHTVKEFTDDTVSYPDVEVVPETVKLNPKSTGNVATKKSVDEKSAYYLQVGAFRDPSDAENARAKLALIGVESSVGYKNAEGDNLYRVRIGPFDNLDQMNRMRSKLVENSIDVAVIKTPK